MLKVGLTGGIGCGKTTVAEMFEQLGCCLFYADRIAHQLSEPGQSGYEKIVQSFGKEILDGAGRVDRKRLGEIVFAEPSKLERLNQILHPRVVEYLERELARLEARQPDAIAIVEAALLIESGYYRRPDKLVVVRCLPEQQEERVRKRFGLSTEAARQRIRAQMTDNERRRYADYEIDSSGTFENTRGQVEQLFRKLQALVAART